jgi:hypothetical protein
MTRKKMITLISMAIIVATIFVGCNQHTEISESTTVTTTEVTTVAKAKTTTKKVETTTYSTTTVQKTSSTTEKQTTKTIEPSSSKKSTTTVKSTTAKPTTTKKQNTTKAQTTKGYFCDEGGTHHSCDVGPIGWVNSYDEAQQKALRYIDSHADSGNFTVEQCWYCGKYTAEVTLD